MAFNMSTQEEGIVSVVKLEGHIDNYASGEVEDVVNKIMETGQNKIVVDMSQVEQIGPVAIRIFLDLIKKAKASDGDMKLCSIQPSVAKILQFAGFREENIAEDVKKTIKQFKGGKAEVKSVASAPDLSEEEQYGTTIQIGSSQQEVPVEEEYEMTVQISAPKAKNAEESEEEYEMTVKMGAQKEVVEEDDDEDIKHISAPTKKEVAKKEADDDEDDEYGRTIQVDNPKSS